jgi:hypothetical protein
MSLILLILFYFLLAVNGIFLVSFLKIDQHENFKNQLAIVKINFCALSFFGLFCSCIHVLAYIITSFSFALYLTLLLSLVFMGYGFFKKKYFHFSVTNLTQELFLIIFTLSFSISLFLKDSVFTGSWDSNLSAFTACLVQNDFYPPINPNNVDKLLSNYHYGTNLVEGIIQIVTQSQIWDAMSFQIAFCFFLSFISIFFLIYIFSNSFYITFCLSIFIVFFNSLNIWELIFFQFDKFLTIIKTVDFLNLANTINYMSIKSAGLRMTYYGWSVGFAFFFQLICFLFMCSKKLTKGDYFLIFIFSLMLYLTYPPMWYLLVGGLCIQKSSSLIAMIFFNKDESKIKYQIYDDALMILILVLGKYLTFISSMTHEDSINLLKFKPQLGTSLWNISYPFIMEDKGYVLSLFTKFHSYEDMNFLYAPLFSRILLREFGLVVIVAVLFFSFRSFYKKFDRTSVFLFSGLLGCLFPFIFEFVLRPIESDRFIVIGKVLLLIYISIVTIEFLTRCNNLKKYFLLSIFIIISVPGLCSLWFIGKDVQTFTNPPLFSAQEKLLIKELKKIHFPGAIALDDVEHATGPQISSFAGFYSTEGEFLQLPNKTRDLALQSLNPFLLKELRVDFLVISNKYLLNTNLISDKKLFQKIELDPMLEWNIYKFNKGFKESDYSHRKNEYIWVLAYEHKDDFQLFNTSSGLVVSNQRQDVENFKTQNKSIFINHGERYYLWSRARAISNS